MPQQTTQRPNNRESRVHNYPAWDNVGSGSDWQTQYERPAPVAPSRPSYHPPSYHHHAKPSPTLHPPHHGYHWQTGPNSESLGGNRQNNGRAENSRILNNNNQNGLASASAPSDNKWHGYHHNPMGDKWNVEPVDSPVVTSAPDSESSASNHNHHSNHRHNWHHPYHNWHHPHHRVYHQNPTITPSIPHHNPLFHHIANTQQQRPNDFRPPNRKESRVIFDKTSGVWAVLDSDDGVAPFENSYPSKRDDEIVTENAVNSATTSTPEGK